MHLLHAETAWNHPAFFDYLDCWMTEDDTQAVAAIKAQTGRLQPEPGAPGPARFWLQSEFAQHLFIDDMWKAYR